MFAVFASTSCGSFFLVAIKFHCFPKEKKKTKLCHSGPIKIFIRPPNSRRISPMDECNHPTTDLPIYGMKNIDKFINWCQSARWIKNIDNHQSLPDGSISLLTHKAQMQCIKTPTGDQSFAENQSFETRDSQSRNYVQINTSKVPKAFPVNPVSWFWALKFFFFFFFELRKNKYYILVIEYDDTNKMISKYPMLKNFNIYKYILCSALAGIKRKSSKNHE